MLWVLRLHGSFNSSSKMIYEARRSTVTGACLDLRSTVTGACLDEGEFVWSKHVLGNVRGLELAEPARRVPTDS